MKWKISRRGEVIAIVIRTESMNQRRTLSFLLLAMICVMLTSCSQRCHIAGVVVDGNGHPIKGAIFDVSPASLPKPDGFSNGFGERFASDADGKFDLEWSPTRNADYFHLLTRCDGYADDYRIVKAYADDIRVVLAKTDDGG